LSFLRFKEIWPDEGDELFKIFDPSIQRAITEEEDNGGMLRITHGHRGFSPGNQEATRQGVHKHPIKHPKTEGIVLSPGSRRTEINRKSQNRIQNKTKASKFLSEERKQADKSKRAISKDAVLSSGFRNYKPSTFKEDVEVKETYISKYLKPTTGIGYKKRNFSKNSVDHESGQQLILENKKRYPTMLGKDMLGSANKDKSTKNRTFPK